MYSWQTIIWDEKCFEFESLSFWVLDPRWLWYSGSESNWIRDLLLFLCIFKRYLWSSPSISSSENCPSVAIITWYIPYILYSFDLASNWSILFASLMFPEIHFFHTSDTAFHWKYIGLSLGTQFLDSLLQANKFLAFSESSLGEHSCQPSQENERRCNLW